MAVRDRRGRARRRRRGRPGRSRRPRGRACPRPARASSAGVAAGRDRLDPAHLGLDADERRDLARVPAQDVDRRARRAVAARCRCGSGSHLRRPDRATIGIPRSFAARPASTIASIQCGESVPMLSTSAPARPTISSTSSTACAITGQRAERERRVRRLVHDDVVRDLVDERLLARGSGASVAPRATVTAHLPRWKTSTGPSPAPISVRPFLTASRRPCRPRRASPARAARPSRAGRRPWPSACSRRRAWPGRRGGRRGTRSARRRRRGGRRRSSPCPPGHDHRRRAELVQPLGELAPRGAGPAGERLGLEQVRRHDRRQREEPPHEHVDRVVLEQLRARARDHDRIDDERRLAALEDSRRPSRSIGAEKSIPVLAASTPMSS